MENYKKRKLTEEEYYCEGQGYTCKGWSCDHFRLKHITKYCMLDVCDFKETTRPAPKNPRSKPWGFGRIAGGTYGECN